VLEEYFAEEHPQRGSAESALQRVVQSSPRPKFAGEHSVADGFHPGSDLALAIGVPATVTEATLWYRHVNHGERWLSTAMVKKGDGYSASIPASYTNSTFPLQYYFELRTADAATLHPPFNATFSNQPYFAIMPSK
jgi:hypothetical protein